MQEGVLDVELMDWPLMGRSNVENCPDSGRLDNWTKRLVIVNSMLLRETPDNPASFMTGSQFVRRGSLKVWITKATKNVEVIILRRLAMKADVGNFIPNGAGRALVQQIGCSCKSFYPIGWWHGSMEHQRAHGIVKRTKNTFGLAVLWGSIGAG
jgi:hypothetical protein